MSKFEVGDVVYHEEDELDKEFGIVQEYLPTGRVLVSWSEAGLLDYPEYALRLETNALSPNEEMVAHPNHYGGDTTYEVIKVIEAWGLDNDAFLFNVIKYTARAGKKGKQLEDLKKAEFYLQRRIAILEASNA